MEILLNTQRIAVLVTCHNRKANTLASLECLYSAILPIGYNFDVYLVDDGSHDGTSSAVRERFPNIKIIAGTGDLFWNRGMHLAWSSACSKKYDFYIWLNDDTYINIDSLSIMLSASHQKNHKAVICGTTVSPLESKKCTYGGYSKDNNLIAPNGELQDCFLITGNFVLIPKFVFDIVGNLDSRYRHAMGDSDYGVRCRQNGIQLVVAQRVVGVCAEHDQLPKWCRPTVNIAERLSALYGPLGCNPFEFFVFQNRCRGFRVAVKHFFSIHLRAFFPKIWL